MGKKNEHQESLLGHMSGRDIAKTSGSTLDQPLEQTSSCNINNILARPLQSYIATTTTVSEPTTNATTTLGYIIGQMNQEDLQSERYHHHIIPRNESIACIPPQKIYSVKGWPPIETIDTTRTSSSGEEDGKDDTFSKSSNKSLEQEVVINSNKSSLFSNKNEKADQHTIQTAPMYAATGQNKRSCSTLKEGEETRLQQPTHHRRSFASTTKTRADGIHKIYLKSSNMKSNSHPISISAAVDSIRPTNTNTNNKKHDTAPAFTATATSMSKDIPAAHLSSSIITDNSSSNMIAKKRRTTTSYDVDTSFYLKSVFFQVYSHQTKLNKQQRSEVQAKTGLPSRNVTYWFSNHKRRFKDNLLVFRKTIKESEGKVNTYQEFLDWREKHGLSSFIGQDEITEAEVEIVNTNAVSCSEYEETE